MKRLLSALYRSRWWVLIFCVGVVLIRWWAQRGKPEHLIELPRGTGTFLAIHSGRLLYVASPEETNNFQGLEIRAMPIQGGSSRVALRDPGLIGPEPTVTDTALYYFKLRQLPRHAKGPYATVPAALCCWPFAGGQSRDLASIPIIVYIRGGEMMGWSGTPSFAIGTDSVYWVRPSAMPGGRDQLMQTPLNGGPDRILSVNLPVGISQLAPAKEGVYCFTVYPETPHLYRYSTADRTLRLVPHVDFLPTEMDGRLYGVRTLFRTEVLPHLPPGTYRSVPPGFSDQSSTPARIQVGTEFVSAAPDGSDQHVLLHTPDMLKTFLHTGRLYLTTVQFNTEQLVKLWRVDPGRQPELKPVPTVVKSKPLPSDDGRWYWSVLERETHPFAWLDNPQQGREVNVLYRFRPPDD